MASKNKKNNPAEIAPTRFEKIFLIGWRPYFWVAFAGLLVYFRTLFFNFSYLDDNALILDNFFFIRNLGNIFKAFQVQVFLHGAAAYFRPVLTVFFMFDAAIGGQSPFIYHLSNVIYHLIASGLVFLLITKLGYRRLAAFFAALIFAVHPVLTQAVGWIPGRNDPLVTIFALASFICLINFFQRGTVKSLFGGMVFFTLAMFTKESAIFILPLAGLYYFIFVGKEKRLSPLKIFWLCLLSATVLAVWFVLRHQALSVNPLEMTFAGMISSAINGSPALIQFIGKALFPFNLSVLPLISDTTFIYGVMAIIVMAVALVLSKNKRWPIVFFGLAWFLVFLVSTFVKPSLASGTDFIEHRMYLPLVGFIIFWLEAGLKNLDQRNSKHMIAVWAVIIIFVAITFSHLGVFSNRIAFWENAVANSPHSPLVHKNLGAMYYFEKRYDDALREYDEALKLNPDETMVHNNIGLIYAINGKTKEAEQEYLKEIALNPEFDIVHYNIGLVYYSTGKIDQALEEWQLTLQINPDYVDAYGAIVIYYYNQKQYDQAKNYFDQMRSRGLIIPEEILKLFPS